MHWCADQLFHFLLTWMHLAAATRLTQLVEAPEAHDEADHPLSIGHQSLVSYSACAADSMVPGTQDLADVRAWLVAAGRPRPPLAGWHAERKPLPGCDRVTAICFFCLQTFLTV